MLHAQAQATGRVHVQVYDQGLGKGMDMGMDAVMGVRTDLDMDRPKLFRGHF
jgi:hypothetical protein